MDIWSWEYVMLVKLVKDQMPGLTCSEIWICLLLQYAHFPEDRKTTEKYHSSSNSSKKWHEKVLQQDKYPKLYTISFWKVFFFF